MCEISGGPTTSCLNRAHLVNMYKPWIYWKCIFLDFNICKTPIRIVITGLETIKEYVKNNHQFRYIHGRTMSLCNAVT